MKYISQKGMRSIYSVSESTAYRIFKEFKEELLRTDCKVPRNSFIDISGGRISEGVLNWFLVNRKALKDNSRRKKIEKYRKGEY